MTAKGFFRGHPIIWSNNRWVYEDDYAELPVNGGQIRPCKKCGALFPLNTSDPCLGQLPNVNIACCGHGIQSQAYIRFTNGIVIENFVVKK